MLLFVYFDAMKPTDEQLNAKYRADAIRQMWIGGAVCAAGLLITVVSYAMADGESSVVFAWGAIVFGAIRCYQGYQLLPREEQQHAGGDYSRFQSYESAPDEPVEESALADIVYEAEQTKARKKRNGVVLAIVIAIVVAIFAYFIIEAESARP